MRRPWLLGLLTISKEFLDSMTSAYIHTDLSPYQTHIIDKNISNLMTIFPRIRSLNLKGCVTIFGPGKITSEAMIKTLEQLPQLTSLDVSECFLELNALKQINELPQVTSLNLENAQAVSNMEFMEFILNMDGRHEISQLANLKYLNLAGTNVTDLTVQELHRLPSLERVNLKGIKVRIETVSQLKMRLPNLTIEE